ncbi:DUF2703 domain-containing protein [Methanoculleus sp. FWC-SCC1]|uniref:DUF2703 domain-containing protein n=1 Tax=Methanoculleus frigidifontis TaxID=2584085 RepID=A0ABT8MAI2_9EURY|nr:DUF2703 domain-containing protein [Methanoculleus sp. FWC-SCC1]MDN7024954.1 DUF2703 domain-containing protein [Methanoculleus sp. FWC-SCC1]
MKEKLVIEWRYPEDRPGTLAVRCGNAGAVLRGTLAEIATLLEMEGIAVSIFETPVPAGGSPGVLFNGIPLEDLTAGMEVPAAPESPCASCAGCEDEGACLEALEGATAVPPDLIGRAALKALETE